MSSRPQKSAPAEGGNKKHRQTPYNKNGKGKAGAGGGPHPGNANAGGVPGVSKIKGQIRQTTRLLAKVSLSDTRFAEMNSNSTVPFRLKGQPRAGIACADGKKTDIAASGSCQSGTPDSGEEEWREIPYGAFAIRDEDRLA
jgi:hypothetical protein